MKKLVSKIFALSAVFTLALGSMTVMAATEGKLYAATDATCENLGTPTAQTDKNGSTAAGVMGLSTNKDSVTGVCPQGLIKFTVNVDKAGTYEIKVNHACKGGTVGAGDKEGQALQRKADLIVNGVRKNLTLTLTDNWTTYNDAVISVHLNKGDNAVWVSTSEDFDNYSVKAPNIDYITYKLTTEDPADGPTTSDATTENTTSTTNNSSTSVKTGDTTAVMTLAIIAVLAAGTTLFVRKVSTR